jgi:hypothetical protein
VTACTVELPERLGRRMSIGPFDDPRDFLRFLLASSCGAVAAIAGGPLLLLPFVGLGALLTLGRSGEDSWWVLLERRARYCLRSRSWTPPALPPWPPRGRVLGSRWYDLAGRSWTIWEGSPAPVSGRSPAALQEEARALLREVGRLDDEVTLCRVPEPIDVAPFLPPRPVPSTAGRMEVEMELQGSYVELLRTAAARKTQVRLLLTVPTGEVGDRGKPDPTITSGLASLGWHPLSSSEIRSVILSVAPITGRGSGR